MEKKKKKRRMEQLSLIILCQSVKGETCWEARSGAQGSAVSLFLFLISSSSFSFPDGRFEEGEERVWEEREDGR